jgi:hypothetical protein
MARRQAQTGHTVRVSAETYARAILAAATRRQHVNEFAERALLDALAVYERQKAETERRDAWRVENGTSIPKPMLETASRPSASFGWPHRR